MALSRLGTVVFEAAMGHTSRGRAETADAGGWARTDGGEGAEARRQLLWEGALGKEGTWSWSKALGNLHIFYTYQYAYTSVYIYIYIMLYLYLVWYIILHIVYYTYYCIYIYILHIYIYCIYIYIIIIINYYYYIYIYTRTFQRSTFFCPYGHSIKKSTTRYTFSSS